MGALLVTLLTFRSIFWVSAAAILAAAGYLTWALRGEAARQLAESAAGAARPVGPLSVTTGTQGRNNPPG